MREHESFRRDMSIIGIGALNVFIVRGNVSLGATEMSPYVSSNDVLCYLEYSSVLFFRRSQPLVVCGDYMILNGQIGYKRILKHHFCLSLMLSICKRVISASFVILLSKRPCSSV